MTETPKFNEMYGVKFPIICPEESITSAVKYQPQPGDIFVVAYPRSGTTWTHYMVTAILRKGQVSEDPLDFFLSCPNIELTGTHCWGDLSKPVAYKSHMPFRAIPYSPLAKYIYVNRNPKDCFVSHYISKDPVEDPDENKAFHEFLNDFSEGNYMYGSYFDHANEWYKHRNDENVHFVTYENLKRDTKAEILKMARFIGKEYEKCLLEDEEIMKKVLYYCSFEYMKKHTNNSVDMFFRGDKIFEERNIPSGLKAAFRLSLDIKGDSEHKTVTTYVRKGIVGDWKNVLTQEQSKMLREKIEEKTAGSDILQLWKDFIMA